MPAVIIAIAAVIPSLIFGHERNLINVAGSTRCCYCIDFIRFELLRSEGLLI